MTAAWKQPVMDEKLILYLSEFPEYSLQVIPGP